MGKQVSEEYLLQLTGLPNLKITELTGWKTQGKCKVRLQIQNTGSGAQNADYYIAAYDKNDKFIKALSDSFKIAAGYPAEIVTKTYTFENGENINHIRAIVLEDGIPVLKNAECDL